MCFFFFLHVHVKSKKARTRLLQSKASIALEKTMMSLPYLVDSDKRNLNEIEKEVKIMEKISAFYRR